MTCRFVARLGTSRSCPRHFERLNALPWIKKHLMGCKILPLHLGVAGVATDDILPTICPSVLISSVGVQCPPVLQDPGAAWVGARYTVPKKYPKTAYPGSKSSLLSRHRSSLVIGRPQRTLCPMRPPQPAPHRTLCPMRPPQPAPHQTLCPML